MTMLLGMVTARHSMSMKPLCALFVSLLVLASNLAAAKSVHPRKLKLIDNGAVYELREPYVYTEKAATWSDRWECGIALPKDATKGAGFFLVRRTPPKGDQPTEFGLIINGIIRSGYGSFDFPTSRQNDLLLRAALQPVTLPK
jgi:hypothetical protein